MEAPQNQRVTIVDVDMPFGAMVKLLIKLAFAAIPAYILVAGLVFAFLLITTGIGSALSALLR